MEQLINLLRDNENGVVEQWEPYSREHGYSDFKPMSIGTWQPSLSGLTQNFCSVLREFKDIPPIKAEDDFCKDIIAGFGVLAAKDHCRQGVTIGQFLGLIKYYRHSYIALVEEQCGNRAAEYTGLINSFFDRVELGCCHEWVSQNGAASGDETVKSSQQLIDKDNVYLNLVESLGEPVLWLDEGLGIKYANSAAKQILGKTTCGSGEVVGAKFPWLCHELDELAKNTRDSLTASIVVNSTVKAMYLTLRAATISGAERGFCGISVSIKDVTSDRYIQNQLTRVKGTSDSFVRAAPCSIGIVKDRAFTWVSDMMCDVTGYSHEELIGNNSEFLYSDRYEYIRAGRDIYTQLNRGGVGTVETSWTTKSGMSLDVLLSASAIITGDLSQGVVFTAHDITATKKLEVEQQLLEVQMQRTQKLESLGVLAGGIAHDFNNMLVSILGNADLVLSELSSHSPVRLYMKDIVTASKRAADLCRQLLAYSGKGKFVIERLDLQELIEQMLHMLEVSIPKNVILKCRFADQVLPVEADATQLRQILMNLVINASEAIGSRSGVISVATGMMDCTEEYLQTTFITEELSPGMYSYIEVADTGKGMDLATREKLFEPFFSTKFSGRGLGMAAVLGIIRGHNGAIKVYSEPGKGTTVKAILPSFLGDSDLRDKESKAAALDWKGEGTILLVDDEESVRVLAKRFLEIFGFNVLVAEDGKVAVDIYTKHHQRIDAVLMDLTMPKLDGEGAFAQMRVINPEVRIVFSSGYNEQEVSQRFLGKGVTGFIQKPYLMAELKKVIKEVMS